MDNCVFCQIVRGESETKIIAGSMNAVQFVPLNPVVEGHVLTIPVLHVEDALEEPYVTAATMQFAVRQAKEAGGSYNFITSVGREATQSVFHLHIHTIPRVKDDGLALPWYSGKGGKENFED